MVDPNLRPAMDLAGHDGNIFCILGRATALLRRNGFADEISEMLNRVHASHTYEEALTIISEYVQTELSRR